MSAVATVEGVEWGVRRDVEGGVVCGVPREAVFSSVLSSWTSLASRTALGARTVRRSMATVDRRRLWSRSNSRPDLTRLSMSSWVISNFSAISRSSSSFLTAPPSPQKWRSISK